MIDVLRGQPSDARHPGNSNAVAKERIESSSENSARQLMVDVISHIEARLPGRIRGLFVYRKGDAFALGGNCKSYYSKQLAQHIALEVLVYKKLINNIKVLPPK